MEIAFEEHVKGVSPRDLAFVCAALNEQMRVHFAPAWLEEPWPVKSYDTLTKLPVGSFWPIAILPDIDAPDASGFHTWEAGLSYGRVRWDGWDLTAITASHEALELRMDPRCNQWVGLDDGRAVALELCDPCEADSYYISVTLFGETRMVPVSDFVLPAYFVKGAPPPYSYLNTVVSTCHELGLSRTGGGYLMVRERDGSVIDYWGKRAMSFGRRSAPAGWRKKQDPFSRVSQRLAGRLAELVDLNKKIHAMRNP